MTFQPRTFDVPLYQGDYQQRIAKAHQQVDEAEDRAKTTDDQLKAAIELATRGRPRLMAETNETVLEGLALEQTAVNAAEASVAAAIEAHNALVVEADRLGRTVVTLRALGRKRWNALVKEHPPRTGDDVPKDVRASDKEIGVNDETFGEALLRESVAAVSDETPVDDLLDAISAAQFDLLYATAFRLNRDGGPIPLAMQTPTASSLSAAGTGN